MHTRRRYTTLMVVMTTAAEAAAAANPNDSGYCCIEMNVPMTAVTELMAHVYYVTAEEPDANMTNYCDCDDTHWNVTDNTWMM